MTAFRILLSRLCDLKLTRQCVEEVQVEEVEVEVQVEEEVEVEEKPET